MPVCIPDALPAAKVLASENIFVMTRQRSTHQDIRPLHIAVLNLMPTKEATETQLLRLIGNTPLQVHVTLLRTATYESQHTAHRHLSTFYRTFEEVRGEKFDALIITGAPVEQMEFSEVGYWRELERVMAWAKENVFSTLFICWANLLHESGMSGTRRTFFRRGQWPRRGERQMRRQRQNFSM